MRAPAAVRALVLLSIVLDAPVLSGAVSATTPTPRRREVSINGHATEIVEPGGRGPWPGYLFVNGAHPERRQEPVVHRLVEGLARAGFLVVIPDPPGLAEGRITPATLDALIEVSLGALEQPALHASRIGLLGASTGASLALLAAADASLREHVSAVVAVTPYADLEKIVCLATTGTYPGADGPVPYPVSGLLRESVLRSLLATMSAAGSDREGASVPMDPELELAGLRGRHADLDPADQAVLQLLLNEDPGHCATLIERLPAGARSALQRLSPLRVAALVRAPVELIVPPQDEYFPHDEPLALARALPSVRFTVTPTLDHTRPSASLRTAGSFLEFGRFVIRGLGEAAR